MKPKPDLEALEEKIEREGLDRSLFPILGTKPNLDIRLTWIWEGFERLSGTRQMGMSGPQPISLSEIKIFLELEKLVDEDEVELFIECVSAMDRVFIKWCAEQAKKKTKK